MVSLDAITFNGELFVPGYGINSSFLREQIVEISGLDYSSNISLSRDGFELRSLPELSNSLGSNMTISDIKEGIHSPLSEKRALLFTTLRRSFRDLSLNIWGDKCDQLVFDSINFRDTRTSLSNVRKYVRKI